MQSNTGGILTVHDKQGHFAITLDGISAKITCWDVELSNADCAEEFDVASNNSVDPGSVVILMEEGKVRQSTEEYDTRVAGVISGAGMYKPGLLLDRKASSSGRVPVTLIGKVFCKDDATKDAVRPGDLLTTSNRSGHAMR